MEHLDKLIEKQKEVAQYWMNRMAKTKYEERKNRYLNLAKKVEKSLTELEKLKRLLNKK